MYSKPAGSTATDGTTIEASMFNTLVDDLVSDANVDRPVTAGGTGSSTAAEARTALGVKGPIKAIDTTGSANAYLLATSDSLTPSDGDTVIIVASFANTGAATIDVDSTGAKDFKKVVVGTVTALSTGDIYANAHYLLTYDSSASAWIINNKEVILDATLNSLAAVDGVAGDILYASGTDVWARLAKGANGKSLTLASGIPSWVASGGSLIHVRDEKSSSTDGGTFTKDVWQTRTLNTIATNEVSGVTLVSDQIVGVPAGTYFINATAPGRDVLTHQARLWNATDSAALVLGGNENSNTTDPTMTRACVVGRFTLAATKTLELQHICSSTKADIGFGTAGSFGTEVYSEVVIWKVG